MSKWAKICKGLNGTADEKAAAIRKMSKQGKKQEKAIKGLMIGQTVQGVVVLGLAALEGARQLGGNDE